MTISDHFLFPHYFNQSILHFLFYLFFSLFSLVSVTLFAVVFIVVNILPSRIVYMLKIGGRGGY